MRRIIRVAALSLLISVSGVTCEAGVPLAASATPAPEAGKTSAAKDTLSQKAVEAWRGHEYVAVLIFLFGGAAGTVVGYIAKWMLEQLSARAAARREFFKDVTKQIASLADKHYWALANQAGVLAGQLEGYLWLRTYHLMVVWPERKSLQAQLDEIAIEAAEQSFLQFCQLVWRFDSFQFQGSSTYLLTNHAAGDMCKRLYNMFIVTLPPKLNLANIREFEIEVDQVPKKLRDLPNGFLTDRQIRSMGLEEDRKAYIDWVKHNVQEVHAAAKALRAYSELLNHELAILYRLWFRSRPPVPEAYVREQALGGWPGLLTDQTATTLMFATYHSSLLRPLGAASTFARELTKVEDKQSDIEGGGKGRLDQHSGSIESATGVTE